MAPEGPYSHPLNFANFLPSPLLPSEVIVQRALAAFLEQPDWTEKATDRTYVTDWLIKAGVTQEVYTRTFYEKVSDYREAMMKLRRQNITIDMDLDGRWKKDGVLDREWRKRLVDAVRILENTPPEARGFPSSAPELSPTPYRDLLDPSMYPIIYGETLSWEDGEFRSVAIPLRCTRRIDGNHCWLPTEFEISKTGESTKILSYINNLSLPGQDLLFHPILEKLFTEMVPLFNYTLADPRHKDLVWNWDRYYVPQWSRGLTSTAGWSNPRGLAERRLEGRTVKVVVRILNIELTPENPQYEGDYWSIDGTRNEYIVATGVYYFARENVTDWSIKLRHKNFFSTAFAQPIPARTINDFEPTIVKENRAVVFSNMYENCISSFGLVDATKPGFAKMVVFHVCNPFHTDPPSTRKIPPQQPGQYEQSLRNSLIGQKLPEEIFQKIISYVCGNMMTEEEARSHREILLLERTDIWRM
ncbi:hypothetical protein TWF281_002982 [Arthrobotrys megalospora]